MPKATADTNARPRRDEASQRGRCASASREPRTNGNSVREAAHFSVRRLTPPAVTTVTLGYKEGRVTTTSKPKPGPRPRLQDHRLANSELSTATLTYWT